jgi:hypothetical protein
LPFIHYHDTAALAAYVIDSREKQALQNRPQIQRGGNVAVDADQ